MMGSDVNAHPILLLVNYWEIRPSHMGAHLDRLLKRDVQRIATFIPWQAAESDIAHTLTRFLQATAERRMSVHLILTPELGIHYPNSGLPKDIISRKENMAQHSRSGGIVVPLPPNAFTLPSHFSPEFNKRYYSFLARMDNLFSDLAKSQSNLLKGVTVGLSGGFWKYYRSPSLSSKSPFEGNAGDYSSHANLAYRQRLENFFAQKEFMDPTPSSANRWKTRTFEEPNRRWFYQQSEDVFRNRTFQAIRKKTLGLKILELEIYTPEADPAMAYTNFFQMVSGGQTDFSRLSKMLDDFGSRISNGSLSVASSYIHWSSMGSFRILPEAERQFLILKSLLLKGGQGGGILMDEAEWFSLSSNFRTRVDTLANSLVQGDLQLRNRVLYLSPHLWSQGGMLWDELFRRVGPELKMISSIDLMIGQRFARLLVVDPSFILTRETIQRLISWAKAGRVVALPRHQLYTEAARVEIEQLTAKAKRIEVDLGLSYRLHPLGEGKLVIYDAPDALTQKTELLSVWRDFLGAILSISEVENYCWISDSRLHIIPFENKDSGMAAFVLNATRRPVAADMIFPNHVRIADLGATYAGVAPKQAVGGDSVDPDGSGNTNAGNGLASRFKLEVPPYGVLPLTIEGLNPAEFHEKQVAALTAAETQANVFTAAASELPGFSSNADFEEVWN